MKKELNETVIGLWEEMVENKKNRKELNFLLHLGLNKIKKGKIGFNCGKLSLTTVNDLIMDVIYSSDELCDVDYQTIMDACVYNSIQRTFFYFFRYYKAAMKRRNERINAYWKKRYAEEQE